MTGAPEVVEPVPPEWHRLHPLTILKELGALAWAIVAALAFDWDWDVPYPGFPRGLDPDTLIAIAVFGYAVVRYLFTAYRLTDATLDLRRGVFFKTSQSMPRDRVQTVAITTGLIGRFLGVTTVEVSAADTEDVKLAYVSADNAVNLRRILESGRRPATVGSAETPTVDGESEREVLATLAVDRLFLFALTDGWFVAGVLVLVVAGLIAFSFGFLIAPLAVAVAVGGWSAARALALVGFKSWLRADRVQAESGLLARRETEAPLARIQAVGVSRPWARRALGFETVEMTTGELALGSETLALTKGMLAPMVRLGSWRSIAERLVGTVRLDEADLRPSSPHAVRRAVVRGVVATAVLATLAWLPNLWWSPGIWPALAVGVVGVVVAWAYARARYRALGWAVDDRHLLVRRGVLDRRLAVVPIGKVQNVTVVATPFQRRLGIATVEVDTAGTAIPGSSLAAGVKAVDLTETDARYLADHLVAAAARISLPDGV